MTALQKTFVAAALAAAIGTGIYEARQASALLSQVNTLEQQQTSLTEQLTRERDQATARLAALTADNEKLNGNTAELLRLRGEVGVLRRQSAEASKTKPQPVARIAPADQPDDVLEWQKSMAVLNDGKHYSMHLLMLASDNQGWIPTNWEHAARFANEYPVSGTNDFELVHKRLINRSELGKNDGHTILVRERLARPTTDGQWAKAYGFADGHAEIVKLPDGNFAAWEEQKTFNPESVPK